MRRKTCVSSEKIENVYTRNLQEVSNYGSLEVKGYPLTTPTGGPGNCVPFEPCIYIIILALSRSPRGFKMIERFVESDGAMDIIMKLGTIFHF